MKLKILLIAIFAFFGMSYTFSDWQDVIDKEEQQVISQQVKILNENFKLQKFVSKDDFENVLLDKLYNKIINSCRPVYYPLYYYDYNGPLLKGITSVSPENTSLNLSYGKTNLQKANVDEPEVLKLTKDYLAYYNKLTKKVYIIKSPVIWNHIDIPKINVSDVIKVPHVIFSDSVKLFFIDNQLIVIWTRYSNSLKQTITDLVFYKIVNWKAKFLRLYDVKGKFKDARIVNNKIYLITSYDFWNIARQICYDYFTKPIMPLRKKISDLYYRSNLSFQQRLAERKKIENEIEKKINQIKENLNKQEILNKLKEKILINNVDILFDRTSRFKFGWKVYPIKIRLVNSSFNNVLFLPTKWKDLDVYNLKFNVVNIVDLNTGKNPNQYVIFGNISNWQIHMTKSSLYLVNTYYVSYPWRCRPGLLCILPIYPRWNFTLIHKLSLKWFNLDYVDSQIIPGQPINQYSMDEDKNWNFRIFTKHYYPERATDLYVFDKNLKLKGKLVNIAPGEEFKASRFVQNLAYLVTFKATDPLFVIDLRDLSHPKIIGELKIPGYSLYLHPLMNIGELNSGSNWKWNVQYLLWIWQQAEEVHWNWSLPKNIKIDVYKVYLSSDEENEAEKWEWDQKIEKNNKLLKVEKLYSYVLGDEQKVGNWWSYTPVFDNPRAFVILRSEDKNKSFVLLLPVYLAKDTIEKRCYPVYKYENNQRILAKENCYEYKSKKPYFVWIKWLKLDLSKWISEILSKNYLQLYEKAWVNLTQWKYKNENHRVSYYKLWNDFVPFEINVNFADFFKWREDKFIPFNERFGVKKEGFIPPKKCFYTRPAPGTITCQMYCGQRWILKNGDCKQVLISAACSCPGFDTKSQCEKACLNK